MRRSFATVLALLLALVVYGRAFDPFPDTEPVKFSFIETYDDVVVPDPDFPSEYIVEGRNLVDISGSAPLALTSDQLSEIDEFTDYEIDVGDFNMSGTLGDDENFDSFSGNRQVNIPVEGFDFNGNDIRIGTISLKWSATRVIFSAKIANAPDDYWIASIDYYPGVDEPDIDRDDLLALFVFGDFCFDTRTVYMRGSAKVKQVEKGGFIYDVSEVRLEGSIDSVAPVITITEPGPSKNKVTPSDVVDDKYTITGTATDTRMVGTSTFPGVVDSVEVQFGPEGSPGPFVQANFDSNTGNWALPNAPIEAGRNSLIVRAKDAHGNYGYTSKRIITYTQKGDLTVTAVAEGFAPEDTGKVVGVVTGDELAGVANRFDVVFGATPVINKRGGVESGQIFRVVAKPEKGSAFDGWTGTINGNVRFTSVSQVLDFETKPNLTLTARFVPNPFGPLAGTYHGFVSGDDAHERGVFLIKVKNSGAFTGKVKIGAYTLRLKGIILGGGHWSGVVVKNGKQFTVSFDLNVSGAGDRLLTGTVTGEEVASTFDADLKDWRKPGKNDTGKTAEAYMGTYNVVMPPDVDNDHPNFPSGIGYGRIKITKLGGVSFVGRLGDGSKAKCSSVLVKRESGSVFFHLFVPLDKKLGNFGGIVTHDVTRAETDLTGTLDWSEPATSGVEPDEFEGKVTLLGSVYQKPPPGTRIMLAGSGDGALQLFGPQYSRPSSPVSFPVFAEVKPVNLNTLNTLGPVAAEEVKLKFSTNSGLFSGSYKDPDLRKTVRIFGAVVQKLNNGDGYAGGVFVRGNRAGYLEFGPATP